VKYSCSILIVEVECVAKEGGSGAYHPCEGRDCCLDGELHPFRFYTSTESKSCNRLIFFLSL
jgi:hypothetical protein